MALKHFPALQPAGRVGAFYSGAYCGGAVLVPMERSHSRPTPLPSLLLAGGSGAPHTGFALLRADADAFLEWR